MQDGDLMTIPRYTDFISKDNIKQVTSGEERDSVLEVNVCSRCGHPLQMGVHDIINAEDEMLSFKVIGRRCRVKNCDCQIQIAWYDYNVNEFKYIESPIGREIPL
jgi:hypothetical protein